jgi:hypothetical protein
VNVIEEPRVRERQTGGGRGEREERERGGYTGDNYIVAMLVDFNASFKV